MASAAALVLGFGAAYAADEAPGAKSDITIAGQTPDAGNAPGSNVDNSGSSANEGALSAPEKGATENAPGTSGGLSDRSAANVPGADAEGDVTNENQGALSAPEKDKSSMAPSSEGGANADSATQVPGASAESGSGTDANPGATSAPEKDRM
jgi:hypothetical protein